MNRAVNRMLKIGGSRRFLLAVPQRMVTSGVTQERRSSSALWRQCQLGGRRRHRLACLAHLEPDRGSTAGSVTTLKAVVSSQLYQWAQGGVVLLVLMLVDAAYSGELVRPKSCAPAGQLLWLKQTQI